MSSCRAVEMEEAILGAAWAFEGGGTLRQRNKALKNVREAARKIQIERAKRKVPDHLFGEVIGRKCCEDATLPHLGYSTNFARAIYAAVHEQLPHSIEWPEREAVAWVLFDVAQGWLKARAVLNPAGVKLPPQPDEAREGSQSPDDGRAPGIGQNPSESTTSNTERRV